MFRNMLIAAGIILVGTVGWLFFSSKTFEWEPSSGSSLEIALGAGNVELASVDGAGSIFHKGSGANFSGGSNASLYSKKSKLVTINTPIGVFLEDIKIVTGAGNIEANFRDLSVENITVTSGAGNIVLTVPESSTSKVNVGAGAGSVTILTPTSGSLDGVQIIPADGMDLGDLGNFIKVDESFQTEGFEEAEVTSTIIFSSGNYAFSITTD